MRDDGTRKHSHPHPVEEEEEQVGGGREGHKE